MTIGYTSCLVHRLVLKTGCSTLPPSCPTWRPLVAGAARGRARAALRRAARRSSTRLESRGEETSIFERHLALEEAVVGSPLVVGNKVVLLQDGPATYQAMFAAIRAARDHINMETYIIEDDEVGRRFADALVEKQAAGVQVNLIYDSVGRDRHAEGVLQAPHRRRHPVLEFNPVNPLTARRAGR